MSALRNRRDVLKPIAIDVAETHHVDRVTGTFRFRSSLDMDHPVTEGILFTSNMQTIYSQIAIRMKTLPKYIHIRDIEHITELTPGLDLVVDILDHKISYMGHQLAESVSGEGITLDMGILWESEGNKFPNVSIEEFIQMVQALVVDPLERGAGNRNIATAVSLTFGVWVESQIGINGKHLRTLGDEWLMDMPADYDNFRRAYVDQTERANILQNRYSFAYAHPTDIHLTESTREYRFPVRGTLTLMDFFNTLQTNSKVPAIIYHELNNVQTQPIYKVDKRLTSFDLSWVTKNTVLPPGFDTSIVTIISSGYVNSDDSGRSVGLSVNYSQLMQEIPEMFIEEPIDKTVIGVGLWKIDESAREIVIRINAIEPFDAQEYLEQVQTPAFRQILDKPMDDILRMPPPKDKVINAVFLFPWKDVRFKIMYDIITNDPLTNWVFDVDEHLKTAGIRTENANRPSFGNYVVVLDPYNTQKRIASVKITPRYMQPRDPLWLTYTKYAGSEEIAQQETQLTPMAPYLHVSVFRANDMQSIEFTRKALSYVLARYEETFDSIWQTYCGMWPYGRKQWNDYVEKMAILSREIAESTAKRDQELGDSKLYKLRTIEPDLFVEQYSCVCMKASLPRIVDDKKEQAELRSQGKQILIYPAHGTRTDVPSHAYTCDNPEYPYPSLRNNTGKNRDLYPLIPCCAKENQLKKDSSELSVYLHELGITDEFDDSQSGMTSVRRGTLAQNIITTNKSLKPGRRGELPAAVKELFSVIDNRRFLRMGSSDKIADSFIDSVQVCLREQHSISSFDKTSRAYQMLELSASKIRKFIVDNQLYWADAQSMNHLSQAQIIQRLEDSSFYLTPRQWTRTLESVFGVQIVAFRRDRTCQTTGEFIVPESKAGYWKYNLRPEIPTVFVIEHEGADPRISGNRIVCESIVATNKTGRTIEQSTFTGVMIEHIQGMYEQILSRIQTNYTDSGPRIMRPIISTPIYSLFDNIIGQHLDSYGRMRAIAVRNSTMKNPVIIVTEPLPPLSVPLLNGTFEYPSMSKELVSIMTAFSQLVGYQRTENMITGIYFKLEAMVLYVPTQLFKAKIPDSAAINPRDIPVYLPYQTEIANYVTYGPDHTAQFGGKYIGQSWLQSAEFNVTFARRYIQWWLKWLAMKLHKANILSRMSEYEDKLTLILNHMFNDDKLFEWTLTSQDTVSKMIPYIQSSQYKDIESIRWIAPMDSKHKLISIAKLHRHKLIEYVDRTNVVHYVEHPYEIRRFAPHSIVLHGDDSLLSYVETYWDKSVNKILTFAEITTSRLMGISPWLLQLPEISDEILIMQSLPEMDDLGISVDADGNIMTTGISSDILPETEEVREFMDEDFDFDEDFGEDAVAPRAPRARKSRQAARGERPRIATMNRLLNKTDVERSTELAKIESRIALYVIQYWKDHRINIGSMLTNSQLRDAIQFVPSTKSIGIYAIPTLPTISSPMVFDSHFYIQTSKDPDYLLIKTPNNRYIPLLSI